MLKKVVKCAGLLKCLKQQTNICKFYPTLRCDIQGFLAMGLSVQYWPRWFQDFPAIWLAVPFGANGAHLGICTLPEKNLLCVWNKLFLGEIKFSQGELVLWNLYGDKLSLCRNQQMNGNLTIFLNNGTCGNTMVKPQTVRYRLIK